MTRATKNAINGSARVGKAVKNAVIHPIGAKSSSNHAEPIKNAIGVSGVKKTGYRKIKNAVSG